MHDLVDRRVPSERHVAGPRMEDAHAAGGHDRHVHRVGLDLYKRTAFLLAAVQRFLANMETGRQAEITVA
jgi:hypothetical protein